MAPPAQQPEPQSASLMHPPTVNWLPWPWPTAAAPALTVVTLPLFCAWRRLSMGKCVFGAARAVVNETVYGGRLVETIF